MSDRDPSYESTAAIRARIDTSKPHSARFWNYFVGGKDNYDIDREVGDQIKEIFPGLVDVARTSLRLPRAGGPASGGGAGDPSVPGHRDRPADGRQHA